MVELVDTLDSGSSGSDNVRVRVSLSPQRGNKIAHLYTSGSIFNEEIVIPPYYQK